MQIATTNITSTTTTTAAAATVIVNFVTVDLLYVDRTGETSEYRLLCLCTKAAII